MTDAHCHVSCGDNSVREFLIGRDFFGVHPWDVPDDAGERDAMLESVRSSLLANPKAGVGEIGLDRLKVRDIPPQMRDMFAAQLELALELDRPVAVDRIEPSRTERIRADSGGRSSFMASRARRGSFLKSSR